MRFGVSSYLWTAPFTDADIGLIDKANDLGFEMLEVPIWREDQFDVPAVTEAFRRTGLEPVIMAAMSHERDPVHPEPAVREKARQYLHYCTDLAVRMGAKKVAGPISSAPVRYWISGPEQRRQELDLCATAMREAAEYAADKGVVLAIEFLNRFESSFINTVADACALVDAVDHPALGVLVDTFHLNIEEKHIGAAIEMVGERMLHFHACENDRGRPGSGHVPWQEVADALRAIEYQGDVVIESFTNRVDDFSREIFLWRSIAPDMDRLASDGLAFLKDLLA